MRHSRVPVPDPYMFGPEWALGLIVCDWDGETVYATEQHDLPERPPPAAAGFRHRRRDADLRRPARTLLPHRLQRDPDRRRHRHQPGSADTGPGPEPRSRPLRRRLRTSLHTFRRAADEGTLHLTLVLDPMHAGFLQQPDRISYELFPVTHFVMPPTDPLEDTQTVAMYEFTDGRARFLHTNCRVHPRVG